MHPSAATTTAPARPDRAGTRADRDVWMDAVRAVALLVVVLGHWLLAVVSPDPAGGLHVQTLLVASPGSHWLTLGLQVMGAFFLVGGAVSVRSWRRARQGEGAYARWLGARAAGLAGPVLPLMALWVALAPLLRQLGLPAELAAAAATNALAPLWFLVVYLLVQAAVPAVDAVVARHGWVRPVVALMAGSALVDLAARAHDVPLAWLGGFLTVWLVPVVLGVALADGRLTRRAAAWLAALGAGGVALLVTVVGYPLLMVGTLPDGGSNQNPPSLALACLVLCHVGLLVLTRDRLTGWLQHPARTRMVGLAAAWSMPVFLWHMSAMALAVGASLVHPAATLGLLGVEPLTPTWWLVRPLWWLVCLGWTAPLLVLAHRWQRRCPARPTPGRRTPTTLAAVVAAALAVGVGSTWIADTPLALASTAGLALAAGALGALPGRPATAASGG